MKQIKYFFCYLLIFNPISEAIAQINIPSTTAPKRDGNNKMYSIEQAISERAQLHTIAFNGLAFITGNFGADCFFPPGKVADYFGFQYMRDNDSNKLGHNTDFLTRIAFNTISILSTAQLNQLIELAKEQEQLYVEFAYKRMLLIKAFRELLEGNIPEGAKGLNKNSVIQFCGDLYAMDAALTCKRAAVMGTIIRSFTNEQKQAFNKLSFGNSETWPSVTEKLDKRSMSHRAHVGVMTYASELFSWYKGSLKADIYFCPERHGTYFGGFYLKDYPAMGNPGYNISTQLTGEAGNSFLDILNPEQRKLMEMLPSLQSNNLQEIVTLRTNIATELRKFFISDQNNLENIKANIIQYGKQDGAMSWYYADAFSKINKTLSIDQKEKLIKLRNLSVLPTGTYLFSDPTPIPANLTDTFLFFE
jgi:hypothetical protein